MNITVVPTPAPAYEEERAADRRNAQRAQQESHVRRGQFRQRRFLRRRRRLGPPHLPVEAR